MRGFRHRRSLLVRVRLRASQPLPMSAHWHTRTRFSTIGHYIMVERESARMHWHGQMCRQMHQSLQALSIISRGQVRLHPRRWSDENMTLMHHVGIWTTTVLLSAGKAGIDICCRSAATAQWNSCSEPKKSHMRRNGRRSVSNQRISDHARLTR